MNGVLWMAFAWIGVIAVLCLVTWLLERRVAYWEDVNRQAREQQTVPMLLRGADFKMELTVHMVRDRLWRVRWVACVAASPDDPNEEPIAAHSPRYKTYAEALHAAREQVLQLVWADRGYGQWDGTPPPA